MTTIRVLTALALVGALLCGAAGPATAGTQSNLVFTGQIVGVQLSGTRCGPFPLVSQEGWGLDTNSGFFDMEQSFCVDPITTPGYVRYFLMEGTHTFWDESSVDYESAEFFGVNDVEACLNRSEGTIRVTITGGTGRFEGVRGFSDSEFALKLDHDGCPDYQGFVWGVVHLRFPRGN